jgi:Domain of unknown function (DUF3841)
MTLWSIQTDAAWLELRERGTLEGRADRVFPAFLPAYQWMMGQMARRLPGYGGGYPVWVWRRPKPDLRRTANAPAGHPRRAPDTVDGARAPPPV